ncbi:MAG: magnesium transporter [Lachnospiraceae bacterium]|nr:magnesium transporter [Lachnospiraceae bacterium]
MSGIDEDVRNEQEEPETLEDYSAQVQEEILDKIRSGLPKEKLRDELSDYHDADIAGAFKELTREERQNLYKALGVQRIAEVFAYLEEVEDYFHEIGPEKAADILEEMDADDAVDLLETLPEDFRNQLVRRMDDEAKEDIKLITSYDDDEVGSMMTTNFIVIERGLSVKGAMKELVRQSADNDNISTIYVIDVNKEFYGAIHLNDLIRARAETDLDDITVLSYPYVHDREIISESIERLRAYSEDSIPVLDEKMRILGIITANDLVEAVDDELGDDYAKLAGLTAEEDLKEPLLASVRKRLPWLLVLLTLGLVVSTVVGVFESVVETLPLVIAFQSLILDMAGNSGTQSLAVTIRVLTDETLTAGMKIKFLFKEMRVGLTDGAILGLGAFVLVGVYTMFLKGRPAMQAFSISGCVGIALWAATIIASMLGTVIPMILKKLKVDPAVASGPLITTINDLVAVVTYYSLAWVLLINVLQVSG